MTEEETEAASNQQVADFFTNVRQQRREKELEKKNAIDPAKLKVFKEMKEATKKKVPELKTNYERSLSKSLEKKRRGGSPSSYIASDESKKKQPTKQKEASTSSTYVASGLDAKERALAEMPTEDIVNLIAFVQESGVSVEAALGHAEPPSPDKNFVPRWPFKLGEPMVRPELITKLPTKMHAFHKWYMTISAKKEDMFGMLVRPEDFSNEGEKVIWLEFKDIYEVYQLDALNTDLIIAWCL
jgi:hypothetical protein